MALIYEVIYKKLEKLGVPKVKTTKILKSNGFMDLHIENLGNNHYSLTHYFEQNGDLVPDPDMEIRIYPKERMAEALTYQDQFIYREVYPDENHVNERAKKELNQFLNQWLTNLINQGFGKEKVKVKPMPAPRTKKTTKKRA
jgi:uncharacterized protein YqiB (DUF1249 family)